MDHILISGYFNARVMNILISDVDGIFEEQRVNGNGHKFMKFALFNNQKLIKILFRI